MLFKCKFRGSMIGDDIAITNRIAYMHGKDKIQARANLAQYFSNISDSSFIEVTREHVIEDCLKDDIGRLILSYIETAFWDEEKNDCNINSLTDEGIICVIYDCEKFFFNYLFLLSGRNPEYIAHDMVRLGHDFFLSRNGDDKFSDKDWENSQGKKISKMIKLLFGKFYPDEYLKKKTYYIGSIVESMSGYEFKGNFIFEVCEDEDFDEKLKGIADEFRGLEYDENNDKWDNGEVSHDLPDYEEIPKDEYKILKKYLNEV